MEKVYVLKLEDESVFGPVYFGSVISKNSMIAMTRLIKEAQHETNHTVDLSNVELLEFQMLQT